MITAISFNHHYNARYEANPIGRSELSIGDLTEDLETSVVFMQLRLKIVQALQANPEASALETIATVTDIVGWTTKKTKKYSIHHVLNLAIHEQV